MRILKIAVGTKKAKLAKKVEFTRLIPLYSKNDIVTYASFTNLVFMIGLML